MKLTGKSGFAFAAESLAHLGDGGLGLLVFGEQFGGAAVAAEKSHLLIVRTNPFVGHSH